MDSWGEVPVMLKNGHEIRGQIAVLFDMGLPWQSDLLGSARQEFRCSACSHATAAANHLSPTVRIITSSIPRTCGAKAQPF